MVRVAFLVTVLAAMCYMSQAIPLWQQENVKLASWKDEILEKIPEEWKDKINERLEEIWKQFEEKKNEAKNILDQIKNNIKDNINKLLDKNTDSNEPHETFHLKQKLATSQFAWQEQLKDIFERLSDKVKDRIKQIVDESKERQSGVATYGIVDQGKEIWHRLQERLEEVGKTVKNNLEQRLREIEKNIPKEEADKVKRSVNSSEKLQLQQVGFIDDIIKRGSEAGSHILEDIKKGAEEGLKGAKDIFNDRINSVKDRLQEIQNNADKLLGVDEEKSAN